MITKFFSFLKKKKITKKKKHSQLSIFMFFFLGFSYTCGGVLFTIAFSDNISSPNSGVGYYIFVAIFAAAFLIGGTALAYSKCSKIFFKSNGSGYIYVRSALGKFIGWLAGIFQYITLPTSVVVAIIALVDQNIGPLIPSHVALIGNKQPYAHLILNLISLIIFLGLFFVLYFGMKWLKVTATIASILQWGTSLIVIIFVLITCFSSSAVGLPPSKNDTFSFLKFNNCVITFIYFYVGFESFSATTTNVRVKNKSTIGKVIFLILITVFIFYMLTTLIFIIALGVDNFTNYSSQSKSGTQPIIKIFQKYGKVFSSIGIALCALTIVGTRINSIILSNFYSSAILQPLAREHYIPDTYKKLNKEKISIKSCLLHTLITAILAIGMIIIPNIFKKDIDVSEVINFSSFFTIIIYLLVIISTLKLKYEKKIYLNIIETIYFYILIVFMCWIGFFYFYNLFSNLFSHSLKVKQNLSIYIMEIVMLFGTILFALIWYFAYYLPKYKFLKKTQIHLITQHEHVFDYEKYHVFEKKFLQQKNRKEKRKRVKISELKQA